MDAPEAGPIEQAIHTLLDALDLDDEDAPERPVYAAQALNLAQVLDSGTAALAIAAVHRELRELVGALVAKEDEGDGDPRTAELLARLSAPLGFTAN